jgi:hypothetical protein
MRWQTLTAINDLVLNVLQIVCEAGASCGFLRRGLLTSQHFEGRVYFEQLLLSSAPIHLTYSQQEHNLFTL